MTVTYKIAMAAGQDAANRQMKAEGRSAWSAADFDLAADTTRKLLGV
jgi:hypothetical protein